MLRDAGAVDKLLELLVHRASVAEDGDTRIAALGRGARLLEDGADDPEGAIAVYEEILDDRIDAGAVEALDRLYRQTERWPDRRALRAPYRRGQPIRRSASSVGGCGGADPAGTDARRRSQRRRARESARPLRRSSAGRRCPRRAARSAGARGARGRAARADLYSRRGAWGDVVRGAEARASAAHDADQRRELLGQLVAVHEERRSDFRAALEVALRVLELEPRSRAAQAEVERIATAGGFAREASMSLSALLATIPEDDEDLLELILWAADALAAAGEQERALPLYLRAYRFAPEAQRAAFDAADRILQALGDVHGRAAHYRALLEQCFDPEPRGAALLVLAGLLEHGVGDRAGAVECYREALDFELARSAATEHLERLLRASESWAELLALLERAAQESSDVHEAAERHLAMAEVLADALERPAAALDELEVVLDGALSPTSPVVAEAVARVERALDSELVRGRAVELLRPRYEASADWVKLAALLDREIAWASTDGERAGLYERLSRLAEGALGDPSRAFEAARLAFELDPEVAEGEGLAERLAEALGRWNDLASTYERALERASGARRRGAAPCAGRSPRLAPRRPAPGSGGVGALLRRRRSRALRARRDGRPRHAPLRLERARAHPRAARGFSDQRRRLRLCVAADRRAAQGHARRFGGRHRRV